MTRRSLQSGLLVPLVMAALACGEKKSDGFRVSILEQNNQPYSLTVNGVPRWDYNSLTGEFRVNRNFFDGTDIETLVSDSQNGTLSCPSTIHLQTPYVPEATANLSFTSIRYFSEDELLNYNAPEIITID